MTLNGFLTHHLVKCGVIQSWLKHHDGIIWFSMMSIIIVLEIRYILWWSDVSEACNMSLSLSPSSCHCYHSRICQGGKMERKLKKNSTSFKGVPHRRDHETYITVGCSEAIPSWPYGKNPRLLTVVLIRALWFLLTSTPARQRFILAERCYSKSQYHTKLTKMDKKMKLILGSI